MQFTFSCKTIKVYILILWADPTLDPFVQQVSLQQRDNIHVTCTIERVEVKAWVERHTWPSDAWLGDIVLMLPLYHNGSG